MVESRRGVPHIGSVAWEISELQLGFYIRSSCLGLDMWIGLVKYTYILAWCDFLLNAAALKELSISAYVTRMERSL